jgi:Na+-driven multidrug efflux pump
LSQNNKNRLQVESSDPVCVLISIRNSKMVRSISYLCGLSFTAVFLLHFSFLEFVLLGSGSIKNTPVFRAVQNLTRFMHTFLLRRGCSRLGVRGYRID